MFIFQISTFIMKRSHNDSLDNEPEKEKEQLQKLAKTQNPRYHDVYGLDLSKGPSPQENVVYAISKIPHHPVTRALFIGNLRKPVLAMQFQNDLRIMVKKINPSYKIDRAWMNKSRTHALVLTNSLEASRYIRRHLNDTYYPKLEEQTKLEAVVKSTSSIYSGRRYNRNPLYYPGSTQSAQKLKIFVDYIMLGQLNEWIFEEDFGPANGMWRVVYRRYGEFGSTVAEHLMLEGDFRPIYDGVSNQLRDPRSEAIPDPRQDPRSAPRQTAPRFYPYQQFPPMPMQYVYPIPPYRPGSPEARNIEARNVEARHVK